MASLTADDFGYSHQANTKIVELARKEKIDRISLLINFPKSKEAIRLYKKLVNETKVPIGLHFNIVEGNNFPSLSLFLLKLLFKKIKKEQIRKELESQIKIFKNHNFSLEHLNSHRNIHLFSPINEIFQETSLKHKIKLVRQKKSVTQRLKKIPLRLIFFHLYFFLNKVIYQQRKAYENSGFEEDIIHPGTTFDR